MIYVDRSTEPIPTWLTDPALPNGGHQETQRARAHYEGGARPGTKAKTTRSVKTAKQKAARKKKPAGFPFEAYGHDTVRDTLNKVFNYKCAYCEARFLGNSDLNVEHWRPKLALDPTPPGPPPDGDKKKKKAAPLVPGYYWLAADWDNLLPSCQHCNQARKHDINGRKITLGKMEQFPIAPGSAHWRHPDDPFPESPLLLDPCNPHDKPEDHLEFSTDDTEKGAIRPRALPNGQPSDRGHASIWVFSLVRPLLTLARAEHVKLIQKQIDSVKRWLDEESAPDLTAAQRARMKKNADDEIDKLRDMRKADQPYALMTRQIVDDFMRKITR